MEKNKDWKDKNVAAVLAFFLGVFGVHRFYLGQTGLGILYCLLMFPGISLVLGFIDALVLFSMDEDKFNGKYNWKQLRQDRPREDYFERNRRHRERDIENWEHRTKNSTRPTSKNVIEEQEREEIIQRRRAMVQQKANFLSEGIRKFKDYDYQGAIQEFEQVLKLDSKDIAAHFNLACAHSLNEATEDALYHLDQAVQYGFNDFEKIKTHDPLAFLRIQPAFDTFKRNGYKLPKDNTIFIPSEKKEAPFDEPVPNLLQTQPDLLDQLQKLGELRERGLLNDEEFVREKRKLLG